jgi:cytosine/adenosine deaminase-related metal-dependent hydrolase
MADRVLELLNRTDQDLRRRVLLRGGYVLSMDPAIGEFVGDVLIAGSQIVAVDRDIVRGEEAFDGIDVDISGAIVLPGLVDPHVHAWLAALSGLLPDVTLSEYMAAIHGVSFFGPPPPPGFAASYTPEDMRIGNLVTSLRCLNSGVTCFIDNSHNARTPEHSRAAVEGLRDAGIRAVHAAGAPMAGAQTEGWPADVLRLRDECFRGEEDLLTLRLFGQPEPTFWEFAREHGFWTSSEIGAFNEPDLERLFAAGLMGREHTFNHALGLSEEMWRKFGDCGLTVNVVARSDTSYVSGDAVPPLAEALANGVPVGLSMDNEVSYGLDMFSEMRTLLYLARSRSAPLMPGEEPTPPLIGVPDVLRLATLGGAANANLASRIGSLTPGKAADLVILRPNRLSLDPPGNIAATVVSYASPADVEAVFVGGSVRKWAAKLVRHDLDNLLDRLAESRERVLADFGAPLEPFESRFWEHTAR